MRIPFVKLSVSPLEIRYMQEAVLAGQLAGNGDFNRRCQEWLEDYLSVPAARLVTSCTSALEMSALLAEIRPGDEVILPSFTFVSTANAFVLFGATPVFVDIEPATLNIDAELIETAITEKTRAICPVHYAGVGCDMEKILQIARKYNLLVIEDGAQGLGSTYRGEHLSSFGDLAAISFHQTKNVTAGGEGGALIINNHSLIARADVVLEKGTNRKEFFQGQTDKYTWVDKGSSFVLSEINAAFLFAQLQRLAKINAERMSIWDTYHSAFEVLERQGFVSRPVIPEDRSHNAHIYYLLTKSADDRIGLLNHLNNQSIGAVFHYIPLHDAVAGTKYGRQGSKMDVTEALSARLVRLPLWPGMEDWQVQSVIDQTIDYFANTRSNRH